MTPFMSEFIGTAVLLTLGDGVVANVVLMKTKGYSGGLIAITFGWAIAVFTGVQDCCQRQRCTFKSCRNISTCVLT